MTKRERAQVVELLRCTAEHIVTTGFLGGPLTDTCNIVFGYAPRLLATARSVVCETVPFWLTRAQDYGYPLFAAEAALEAAQRVEEGTWP